MKKSLVLIAVALMCTMAAVAQDVPKFEVPLGFSFVNVHPDLSPITSFNIFGGGGGFVYNLTPWIGIKADFEGYTQGSGVKQKLINNGYTVAGNVQGNVFTYMFGPQIKKHSGKFQPFGQALFGAAHSNAYGNIYDSINGLTSASSNNNAFAMEFGGGLDYAVTPHFQIRPVEVDYLYTRFGVNGTNYVGNQNNFKYFAGVNFTFGGK
jgi:opacity protein-like surface antigen